MGSDAAFTNNITEHASRITETDNLHPNQPGQTAVASTSESQTSQAAGDLTAVAGGPDGLELASEIAHDIRSPLTAILTLADVIRTGASGPLTESQRRQLGLIYSAALALTATASNVLELAHHGTSLAGKRVPFSIAEIFDSLLAVVQPMAEGKNLEVRLVPPDDGDRRVGYPLAISRVLLNLTTNALKFTEAGYVEVAANVGNPVEFSVRDTGPGISAGALATLFQPFRARAGGAGHSFSGTGLGLTICRRLVRAMSSELQIDTSQRPGTRFWFELKLPPAE